jgi:murein DD-endopeptidase MepM/ murein hydrolase activator NlpD
MNWLVAERSATNSRRPGLRDRPDRPRRNWRRGILALLVAATVLLPGAPSSAERFYVVLDPPIVYPGAVVRFRAGVPRGLLTGTVVIDGRTVGGELEDGLLTIYFAADLDTVPGPHQLRYQIGDRKGSLTTTVRARKFEIKHLAAPPAEIMLNAEGESRVEKERVIVESLLAQQSEERLWAGSFVPPLEGKLGAPFGLRRIVAGERRTPHSGLDIKAPVGTDVVASNFGRVVLAAQHLLRGNIVIIDHGWGLFSSYAHLSEVFVTAGQHVRTGELVGRVGRSGYAEESHVHFGVSLAGARVDPITLPGVEWGPLLDEIERRRSVLFVCEVDEDACDEFGRPLGPADGVDVDADANADGGH